MKQFFLLTLLFALLATFQVQAQDCPYSKPAATRDCSRPTTAAKAAAMDASIEKRFDEKTGQATYVRKEVCAATGRVSYTAVEYCSRSGKFVNLSPREKQCVKSSPGCTAKGVRATKVSGSSGKVHCTTAQKAACAKAGNNGAADSPAKAKLVKNR